MVSWEYTPKHAKGNDYTIALSRTTLPAPYGDPMTGEKSALPSDEVRTPGDSSQNSTGVKSALSRATFGFSGKSTGKSLLALKKKQEEQENSTDSHKPENQNPMPPTIPDPIVEAPLVCEKCFRRPAAKGEDWCQRCLDR